MATESKGQVRYCLRCDRSGSAGMRRLIDSPVVEHGMVTDDDEMEIWVRYDCLAAHRAKVLAEGLGAIGRYKQQEETPQHATELALPASDEDRCRGLLQQLADDLGASGHTAKW